VIESQKSMANRSKQFLGPVLWATFIFATSSGVVTTRQLSGAVAKVSGPVHVSQSGFEEVWKAVWWIFVKGWHATEFAVLAWLLLRALTPKPNALRNSAIAAGTYALFDELHQVYVAGRGGRMSDVMIDWIGIGVFALLWHCTWPRDRKVLVFTLAVVAIFLLSILPTPTFPLPGAPESNRFNP
jgi:VanZ family protein